MKKRKKRSSNNKNRKKQKSKSTLFKKVKKTNKKISKLKKQKKIKKKKNKKKKITKINKKLDDDLISKVVKFQLSLKPKFNFKLSFNLEKYIQSFFDKISETIEKYKTLKEDQRRKLKLEQIEKERLEKIKLQKEKEEEEKLKIKIKEQALKDEIKLEKQRNKDIKLFLRKEQALIRIEQAEKQKQFLQQLKLKKKREDYAGLQQRIEKLKEKYRIIRDQKIRERVEALGVKIQGDEDRETLLQKEKEYTIARQKIEFALESFYRSASSLVFQLNKRHITRHMSILRCIDRRFETGEIFVNWDEAVDEEWLLLIYIKDNSPDEGIVIDDKTY